MKLRARSWPLRAQIDVVCKETEGNRTSNVITCGTLCGAYVIDVIVDDRTDCSYSYML